MSTARFADMTPRFCRTRSRGRAIKVLSVFLAVLVVDVSGGLMSAAALGAQEVHGTRSVTPAAKVGNELIALEEVQQAVSVQLAQIEQQRYALLCQKLEQLIGDRLIAQEANRRAMTLDGLLKAEVYAKAGEVTGEEVTTFITQNQARLPQGDEVDLRLKVSDYLRAQKITRQRQAYLRDLRVKTSVSVSLEEPATGRRCLDSDRYAGVVARVLPEKGYTIPIKWGNLGVKLVELGVIDLEKFKRLYSKRGPPSELRRVEEPSDVFITIASENQRFLLTVFWGLGLANKNPLLDKALAEHGQEKIMGLASTGGWTLGTKSVADLYSRFDIIRLTPDQQALVSDLARSIYRPCCNNPTAFPDCNHGIAMLGLIQLMAAQGFSREDILKASLQFSAFWFPEQYVRAALLFELRGMDWDAVNPAVVLGARHSSLNGWGRNVDQELNKIVFVPQKVVSVPSQTEEAACGV